MAAAIYPSQIYISFFFLHYVHISKKKFVFDAKKNVKKNNSMLSLGTYKKNKQKWSVIGDRCWSICTPLSLRECAHTYHAPHVISPCLSLSPFDSLSLSLCLWRHLAATATHFDWSQQKQKKKRMQRTHTHTHTHAHTQSRACR